MKNIVTVCIIFVVLVTISCIHVKETLSVSGEILQRGEIIEEAFYAENWEEIDFQLSKIKEKWMDNRLWACLTLSTKQIDEIEISLEQCIEYAYLREKPDFIGEFKMFSMMVEHLPKQETVTIEELL